MTLQEIKDAVELAARLDDLDNPYQMDEFCNSVYDPIHKALSEENRIVIDYLMTCSSEDIYNVCTPIKSVAIERQHPEVVQLYKRICSEQGFRLDERIAALET